MISKEYVKELSESYFGKSYELIIDEYIKPHLDKNNKIKNNKYRVLAYDINCKLFDMCMVAPPYEDINKLLRMIEICGKEYIIDNYTTIRKEQEEEEKFDISLLI